MPKISNEKRRARQQQILDAATRCFARYGFHRTSMADVVKESGLSPGAIYCYYRGKQEIVEAISVERHARDSALIADFVSASSLSEGLHRVARTLIGMLKDPGEKMRRKVSIQFWAESLHDHRILKIAKRGIRQRDGLTEAMRNAQQSGRIPQTLDVESLSRILLALLQGLILQQAWEPEMDIEAYVKTAIGLVQCAFSVNLAPEMAG
jgi:AcrR family transcriptional regulator